ncbi:hypothetical protein A3A67_05610 [Candidatus Peribacteria bacterium RIFCSPLOWO2_01_FULL_51_18]|nr:MAG: hypothetical protein A3C52_02040 [Candidatus Peribacteria bacterium RIFCSPHIGHO2_02_FULL_51_15]OGJ65406.1 MAG: hypothetical protein A3A67_05610 [Candidatus Peribacteria bacterium RIFCSPLOWO2_01_FULL_51_18]OGJ68825.1 MAG: hypothetical protein A3J34_04130 [Candidatus Peribacteria bacterium RIFCSPLOWO2_02_FULL_51_10]
MLSIVLPCYNEEQNIESIVHSTMDWLKTKKFPSEIVIVNDGSTDKAGEVLQKIIKSFPSVKIVTHEKNLGYGVAVRSGCDAAKGDIVGFMDSDGQFDPRDFDRLLPWLENFQFVTGRRAHRADPLVRCLFGKLLGAMNFLVLGLWVRDINCGLKIFRREVWNRVRPVHGVEKLFNTEVFLNLKSQKISWRHVNVPHYPRKAGKPTGGSLKVIFSMFTELKNLRSAKRKSD